MKTLIDSHTLLFDQIWIGTPFTVGALNKCKQIMAAASDSGDITGNVIFGQALHELTSVSQRLLNRFGQS